MKILGLGLLAMALVACSTGTTTRSGNGTGDGGPFGSAGTSGTSGTSGTTGGTTGAPSSVNPAGSAPGERCNTPSDCLIVYCDCANHSVVNSQRCVNDVCQTPQSACPGACMGFGSTWSGTADIE